MARVRKAAEHETGGTESIRARIREAGLRCTAARVAVLEHMHLATGPLSHADVSEALAEKSFDRATIYRNLTELTEAGLLSRVELGDHVWRFETKRAGHADGQGEDHPHFLCTSCGEVSCLDDVHVAITPKAPKASAKRRAIRSVREVLLKGQCGKCGDE
ncbi:MAG: transcriptional repressor [Planctomycetia bacterium]|nr:transcriptional repressor [Planctomycetia bacterium]